MAEKKVKEVQVVNNRDRYYNGVRKGGILTIPENELERYENVGFSLFEGKIETKENIVNPDKAQELRDILDHAGVEYHPKLGVKKLQALVDDLKKDDNSQNKDVEALKTQLLDEEIVTEDELEGKTDEDILEIAKTNGLTE